MAQSPILPGPVSDEPFPRLSPAHLAQYLWRTRLLLGVVLFIGMLASYQLVVTLVQPTWASLVTELLRALVALLAFVALVVIGWQFANAGRPEAWPWWILSLALLAYALGQSLASVYQLAFFPQTLPFPWWPDLLFLLEYFFFFLALALWPSFSQSSRPAALHWKVVFDSLLLMSAATALSWYFLLAPIYLESQESGLGKTVNIAYAAGDLAVIFGLVLILMPRHAARSQAERVALLILTLAAVLLIVGDTWYAWLNLQHRFTPAAPPALFWLVASLLAPLAGLTQLRLMQHQPSPHQEQLLPRQADFSGSSHLNVAAQFLLPFAAVLFACAAIALRAIIGPVRPMNPLFPLLVIFGLLLLGLIRQGITLLENVQLQRKWALALAQEQALQEINRRMEAFLGIAGHELKTPLTTIILSLQMVQRRAQQRASQAEGEALQERRMEGSQNDLELALRQAERLNRLVSELLDTSRIQAGKLNLAVKREDLAAIVRLAVEEQRQAFPERTISLHLPEEFMPVLADADRIGQVVTNYLTNALKYSQEDRPVEVGGQVEGQQARVWVRDQGPGLLPAEQERIWERFHRVPGIEVQSGSGIGLGLGLHISKTIIELHQGQVGVQSLQGHGSTFWFTVPLSVQMPGKEE